MFPLRQNRERLRLWSAHPAAEKQPYPGWLQGSGILTEERLPWEAWMYPELTRKHCFLCIPSYSRMLHCLTIRFWKISESETKTPQMNRSLLLRNLPMWTNLQKNYRMDGIPISGKMAVNFPAESASASLLPVHF